MYYLQICQHQIYQIMYLKCAALTVTHWQYGALGNVATSKLHRGTFQTHLWNAYVSQHVLCPDFVMPKKMLMH